MSLFKGAGVAITTPFKENGEVDYGKFAEQIEFQIENKTDSIIVCGTTGEAACLTEEEHMDVIRFCIKQVNHRVPVIAGTGSNNTMTAIHLSEESEKAGADGLLMVTPYYNKTTQAGLIDHFTTIGNKISIPIILYSIQSRTGMNIAPETLKTLVESVPSIVGVKEASGNISQVAKIRAVCPQAEVYSGDDDQTVPMLSIGALGVISVVSNIAPRYVHDMCADFFAGNLAAAAEKQLGMMDLVEALFCETNPIPVKYAMQLLGRDTGILRKPLIPMQEAGRKKMEESLKRFGLL